MSELAEFQNFSHFGSANQLEVSAEATGLMESIGNRFPGVKRHKALGLDISEIEILQSGKNLIRSKVIRQSFLQQAKNEKGKETGEEMSLHAVLTLDKDRSGREIGFLYAKTCLNLPPALTNAEDISDRIL